jgi:phage terminase small subunit
MIKIPGELKPGIFILQKGRCCRMAKLTDKQQKFVEEYLIDLNATQAAIRAGYSVNTANEQGARLLVNVSISNAIAKAMAERSRRTGISADRIVNELAKIAFVNPADIINFDEATVKDSATRDDTATISSVKVKTIPTEDGNITEREIKMYDKTKALELLGKHLGMFTDKFKVEGAIPVVIQDDMDETDD